MSCFDSVRGMLKHHLVEIMGVTGLRTKVHGSGQGLGQIIQEEG